MSLHKLTAGSGYDYLTRQVARHDATEQGHTGLASYYTERGETPGQWIGSGVADIDGLDAGDVVTAEQMQALFGSGHHPLADQRQQMLSGPGLTARDYELVARLGIPFKVHDNDVSEFRKEVARRLAEHNEAHGHPGDWPVRVQDRARIRTEVGTDFFRREHGRDPQDAREVAATIAKHSRPRTTAVAGYDLTFSPVKSVSALWALADPSLAAQIETAHQAAIKDALDFIEDHALFSRTGAGGVQQVDVTGLVATAFTHRDSRAGDPDLHTHVAIANKVRTRDGRWLSIDGRVLYKATVAASETYNTALEKHLTEGVGVRFEQRPNPDPRKRPVREIVAVDAALSQRWSARRESIQARRAELAREFQAAHGRPPSPVESIKLAQQATLETREAKKEPRTLAEQRTQWWSQARDVLGSDERVRAMVSASIGAGVSPVARVDRAWVTATAGTIGKVMEGSRSTWQTWHVRAEAQRQVRALDGLAPQQVDRLVQQLVDETLGRHSVPVTREHDPVAEPAQLTRASGESVYRVHGAVHYTSLSILAAEERLVTAGGSRQGWHVDPKHVDLALLESTANGVTLNSGQAHLVRQMATTRSQLQLAIAPAGAGKTTAMRALSNAWTSGGGTVLGLAPSAAAAAVLGDQIEVPTDTLAKLVWALQNAPNDLPEWARAVDKKTLLVIDEAGMADTPSLDTVVSFALQRGASVRLIGDDQQLAAIGAGGVLRDLEASHGALRLNELMRFSTPGEGAASLALRDGDPQALGFYLDRGRVHVGDLSTMTEEVFESWRSDRASGRDAIMLAPTRDLVAQLNDRARSHRLEGGDAGPEVRLADGLQASVGDRVITRSNDRRLRVSPTDWVKNGDRWSVLKVHDSGALTVQHTRHERVVTLPAAYVDASVELGYASTVHGAQGISVDASHALVTDQISRQSLYTALTRGAQENHVYLEVVGDGDEHGIIRPETVRPETATDLLEGILARDASPVSATTQMRLDADPATLLSAATARYTDALYHAAEDLMGPVMAATLEPAAETAVPGVTDAPAWPALRVHLILLSAAGQDPIQALTAAAAVRELDSAHDKAAVLDWRLDDSGLRNAGPGPLPWLPAVPEALVENSTWGPYLSARSDLVTETAERVRSTCDASPAWTREAGTPPSPETVADVEVWRAARGIDSTDLRPTGPTVMQKAAYQWQHRLDERVAGSSKAALEEWGSMLRPHVGRDQHFLPVLAARMAAVSRAGVDAPATLRRALAEGPLPDDHAAAALWWRINGHLSPAVAAAVATDHPLSAAWQDRLTDLLAPDQATAVRASQMWPHLVTAVDHGLQAGWTLETLLAVDHLDVAPDELAWALTVRVGSLTDPAPIESEPAPDLLDEPPEDLWEAVPIDTSGEYAFSEAPPFESESAPGPLPPEGSAQDVETVLALAALHRPLLGALEPSDAEVEQSIRWAVEADDSPVTPERIAQINAVSWDYFHAHLSRGWVPDHLADRFGENAGAVEAGYAPNSWTALIDHLREHGVTDQEMESAGVATRTRTGSLIDRFRDRAILPIVHQGQVLGFVGRRHPDATEDDRKGPKYLNTADTPLFHKGAQLYVSDPHLLDRGAVPVLVEGPMDAVAVTLAGEGAYVGVAPLGTSLTQAQALQLAHLERTPIVATDADLAGRVAAERAFWMLAQHNLDAAALDLPETADPADVLRGQGPAALRALLDSPQPLGSVLVAERLANVPPDGALNAAAQVLSARHPDAWEPGVAEITSRLHTSTTAARRALSVHAADWNRDPAKQAHERLGEAQQVRQRLQAADDVPPTQRWASLARALDARLPDQPDWPALAAMLQDAHERGHDVAAAARAVVPDTDPLGIQPAQDLRYRLAAQLPATPTGPPASSTPPPSRGAAEQRRAAASPDRTGSTPRR